MAIDKKDEQAEATQAAPEASQAESVDERASRTEAEFKTKLEEVTDSDLFDEEAKNQRKALLDALAGKTVTDARLIHLLAGGKKRPDFDAAVESLRRPMQARDEAAEALTVAKAADHAAAAELAKKQAEAEAASLAAEAEARKQADEAAAAAALLTPEGKQKAMEELSKQIAQMKTEEDMEAFIREIERLQKLGVLDATAIEGLRSEFLKQLHVIEAGQRLAATDQLKQKIGKEKNLFVLEDLYDKARLFEKKGTIDAEQYAEIEEMIIARKAELKQIDIDQFRAVLAGAGTAEEAKTQATEKLAEIKSVFRLTNEEVDALKKEIETRVEVLRRESEESELKEKQDRVATEVAEMEKVFSQKGEAFLSDDSTWNPDVPLEGRSKVFHTLFSEGDSAAVVQIANAAEAAGLIQDGKSAAVIRSVHQLKREWNVIEVRAKEMSTKQQAERRAATPSVLERIGAGVSTTIESKQKSAAEQAERDRLAQQAEREAKKNELQTVVEGLAALQKEEGELAASLLEGEYTDETITKAHDAYRSALTKITSDERFWSNREIPEREKLAHACLEKGIERTILAPELVRNPKAKEDLRAGLEVLRVAYNAFVQQYLGLDRKRHPKDYEIKPKLEKAKKEKEERFDWLVTDDSGLWKDTEKDVEKRKEAVEYAMTDPTFRGDSTKVGEHERKLKVSVAEFLREIQKYNELVDAYNRLKEEQDAYEAGTARLKEVREAIPKETERQSALKEQIRKAETETPVPAEPITVEKQRTQAMEKVEGWERVVREIQADRDRDIETESGEDPLERLQREKTEALQEFDETLKIYAEHDLKFARQSQEERRRIVVEVVKGNLSEEELAKRVSNPERLMHVTGDLVREDRKRTMKDSVQWLDQLAEEIQAEETRRKPRKEEESEPEKVDFRTLLQKLFFWRKS